MTIEYLLKQFGLSKNEAKVYLAAIEMGLSSAQNIAAKAGVPRTTGYSVLNYLAGRGMVAKSITKGKTKFLAEPPSKLLSILKDLEKNLEKNIPQLEALYNQSETKPKILYYEGKEAMQKVYDDTLQEKPKVILEWNTNDYFEFEKFSVDPHYIAKRMKLGIKAKRIAGEGSRWQSKHKKYDQAELSETVIVPKDKFWPHVEINIYNNKVAFLDYAEELSIIIESKPLAEAIRQAYELSWIGAKKLEVKE